VSLDFVALDVETANSERGSVCSFGLAVVEDGLVVRTENWLTRPPARLDWFDGFNVALHGITPAMVEHAPAFDERLAQVLEVVGDQPVVAHNAAFDIGAIRQGCDAASLAWPELSYACTLVLSRRILSLLSYRLPIVCEDLGISLLDHHQAGADAHAAARIALALAGRQGATSLEELASSVQVRLGRVKGVDWRGCAHDSSGSPRPRYTLDPDVHRRADPSHPLYGQVIVFTGALAIRRDDAWAAAASFGAMPEKGVSKRTTMLVVGDGFAGDSVEQFQTGKAAKALHWQAKGHTIEVLTEGDFLEMLEEQGSSGTSRPRTEAHTAG
jgi:DNA polymerase-3 subunit epsilon